MSGPVLTGEPLALKLPGDIKEQLEALLARHAVLCAVFAQKNGEDVLRLGDFERLEHGDLSRLLFGGQRELVALHASLEGRILPQTYRQGSVECVVSRTDAFVYGLFIERSVDMKASYMAKKKLREAVDAVLALAEFCTGFEPFGGQGS
jgi:hypothetical protein